MLKSKKTTSTSQTVSWNLRSRKTFRKLKLSERFTDS